MVLSIEASACVVVVVVGVVVVVVLDDVDVDVEAGVVEDDGVEDDINCLKNLDMVPGLSSVRFISVEGK